MLKQCVTLLLIVSINCLHNPYCDLACNDSDGPVIHTVCKRDNMKCGPDPKCGPDFKIIPLDDKNRNFVTNLHNILRNKVASGKELRGGQPSASNMQMMTYNRELEFIAQCWANKCKGKPLEHDICRRTKKYDHIGQNLAFVNSSIKDINIRTALKQMIMYWYNEVAIYKKEWVLDTQDRGPNLKIGHYTQMVWADSNEIGCAMIYYTSADKTAKRKKWHLYLLACNYGPGGNYIGAPVYKIGQPRKTCQDSKLSNKNYNALCGKTNLTRFNSEFTPIFKL